MTGMRPDVPRSYRRLLSGLLASGRHDLVPVADLGRAAAPGRVRVGLRHDIDSDLEMALPLARLEAALGVSASYYALHTASYYWAPGRMLGERDRRCVDMLGRIQSYGHEIGLHNDCLLPLVVHGVPAEETLAAELDWLRANGLQVTGTASHGSYHTYLAANYEIFRGLSIAGRQDFTDARGRDHPLGRIDPERHGLRYEANYLVSSSLISAAEYERMNPGFTCPAAQSDNMCRGYDAQFGIFGRNRWLILDARTGECRGAGEQEVIRALHELPAGAKAVLDSHPEYYGGGAWRAARGWARRLGARARRALRPGVAR